ncbi:MAG: Flavobacterium phage, partial [Bacteroidota bacterium]
MVEELVSNNFRRIQSSIYNFSMKTLKPSEWAEKNLILSSESKFAGLLSYNRSPHTREIVDNMRPNSGVEITALMKCSQSAGTQTVVIPCMIYHIAESPTNVMFLSSNDKMVQNTIRGRFDPLMESSGLSNLLKTASVKKANQRTGDTDFKKEYTGGTMINTTYNSSNLRYHSVEVVVADEFDDAPYSDKEEGSTFDLVVARTKSYADTRRLCFVSSPKIKGTSNIEKVYNMGDKRQWNWECPHCKTYIPILWRVEKKDGGFGGIKWEFDKDFKLIPESVHYECQNCGGKIKHKDKYKLNLKGKWIPTCEPENPRYRSYQFNALCNPPGFESWSDLASQFLKACPPNNGPINTDALKTFTQTQLGELWEDRGKSPRSSDLMKNQRSYKIGVIPDETIARDGNGKIAIISLACDLGGVMDYDTNNEDVRLDWEIVVHTTNGQMYSVNQGSIGTFKRTQNKTKDDILNDKDRKKCTAEHNVKNSIWDKLKDIIYTPLEGESGMFYDISISVIDTGFCEKLVNIFIESVMDRCVLGVKGQGEENFRKLDKNGTMISHSKANKGLLYHIDVNMVKDIVSSNMSLKQGTDGSQPDGFMNFPQPADGKYSLTNYFAHYEAEHRVPEVKNGVEVGSRWVKKREENHFFDVAVYNYAAREIFIADLKLIDKKEKDLTWLD